jgi:hypothetical protein
MSELALAAFTAVNIGLAGSNIIQAVSGGDLPDSIAQVFQIGGVLFDSENMLNMMKISYKDAEITESLQANYESFTAINRTTPLVGFSHVSNRIISFRTYFIGDIIPMIQVQRKIKWLQSFLYPRDNGLVIKPPKEVILMLGFYIMIRGVIKSINVVHNYGGAAPNGIGTALGFISTYPVIAAVDITIEETRQFWTGGQITYEQASLDAGMRIYQGADSALSGILNLV